ncbi:hypothetical protein ACPPVO_24595 [Dactylosporangium sp. McL0621]|uniref:hypothetical protein n=1 Tax=Dactylosporangium sp. McL0621 TaxID=3415678 RepID=UPI003CF7E781
MLGTAQHLDVPAALTGRGDRDGDGPPQRVAAGGELVEEPGVVQGPSASAGSVIVSAWSATRRACPARSTRCAATTICTGPAREFSQRP